MGKRSGDCAIKVAGEDTANTLLVCGGLRVWNKTGLRLCLTNATPEDNLLHNIAVGDYIFVYKGD